VSHTTSALARLVGDPDTFLADAFGRAPVHRASAGDTFQDLLSLDDVDHVVAATGLRTPSFRLVRAGRTLPASSVTRSVRIGSRPVGDLVDVAAVHHEFREGASVVLQGLHRSWTPVATFCRSLEVPLTHPVQANAYLTPPVAQGLDLHADAHDVFAIQTHGVKRWVVHPPGGTETWDLELRPGDVLYLPAGTRHAAQTLDRPSLHLTIGVRTVDLRSVVRRALEKVLADPALDAPLPAGWADDPAAHAELVRHHLDTAVSRAGDADVDGALEAAAERFWSARPPDLTGGLRDLLELDGLDDTTPLRRRADATYRVVPDGEVVRLVLGDRTLELPATATALLQRVGELDRLVAKDLAELADEPSRLVLCRRLVREGALTFDRRHDRVSDAPRA
jgi:bifunctional lysine-specific demethylase and histidyl-hydroxylase NO66